MGAMIMEKLNRAVTQFFDTPTISEAGNKKTKEQLDKEAKDYKFLKSLEEPITQVSHHDLEMKKLLERRL